MFLACARVRGLCCPACLVVSCGCRKRAGREPAWLVLSPLFLLWSGWRDSNPLPSPWEGDAQPVELHSQCAPRPFACVCFLRAVRPRSIVLLALGGGADGGNRTRVICLEGRRSTIELHPRVAPPRFACGFCLPGHARVGVFCRWSEVGWLVPARLGVCLSASAGRVFVGVFVGWWRAWCFVGAG